MNFLRSKKILVALSGLLVIGVALVVAFTGNHIKYGEADSSLEVIKRAQQVAAGEASRNDTDTDGLYDWEETLWGTDPENSDTDGDGDNDGKEVDANRNPAVAGPEDTLTIDATTGAIVPSGNENDFNETDKVGQAFFVKYLELRQSGMLQNGEAQGELFEAISESIIKQSLYKNLDVRDILIGGADGSSTAKAYGNVIASVIAGHPGSTESEAVILLRALQEDTPTELEKLDPIIETYHGLYTELKTIVVPRDAGRVHLDLLNATGQLEQTIRDMRKAFTDPVVMFGATARYPSELEMLETALVQLRTYLLQNNVQFEMSDAGSLLMTLVSAQ